MRKQFQRFFEQRRLARTRRADKVQSQCAARVQCLAQFRRNPVIRAQHALLNGHSIHVSSI